LKIHIYLKLMKYERMMCYSPIAPFLTKKFED
jgi:hypothetical protein